MTYGDKLQDRCKATLELCFVSGVLHSFPFSFPLGYHTESKWNTLNCNFTVLLQPLNQAARKGLSHVRPPSSLSSGSVNGGIHRGDLQPAPLSQHWWPRAG